MGPGPGAFTAPAFYAKSIGLTGRHAESNMLTFFQLFVFA